MRFDFDRLVAAGVPEQIAIQYAGVREATGEVYAAPASQPPAIDTVGAGFTEPVVVVQPANAAKRVDFDRGRFSGWPAATWSASRSGTPYCVLLSAAAWVPTRAVTVCL